MGDVWRFFWRGELTSMPRPRDSKRRSTWRPLPETPGTPSSCSSCTRTSGPSHSTVSRRELIFVKTAPFYYSPSLIFWKTYSVLPSFFSLSNIFRKVRTTSGSSFRGTAWKPKSCEPFELGLFQRAPMSSILFTTNGSYALKRLAELGFLSWHYETATRSELDYSEGNADCWSEVDSPQ